MRGQYLLAELTRYPWAIESSWMPLVSSVLTRVALGDPMSPADRAEVERGRAGWRQRMEGLAESLRPEVLIEVRPARAMEDDYEDRPPPPAYLRIGGEGRGASVAIVGVYGVLTQRGGSGDNSEPLTSMSRLAATITQLANDPSIDAIVLDVDSPGGSVYGTAELGDAIYNARAAKPVCAVANSLAASAAYWTACQAGELYAAPGAEVGSIGVYTTHTNVAEALKQRGIAVEYISAGKYKTELNPAGPLTDEARAYVQAGVDSYYDDFVRAVARGRGVALKSVREGMGQGRVLQPDQAMSEKMIDGVATLAQVVDKMRAKVKRASKASARATAERELDLLG
jgi:signal peptide peptidase SppA